MNEVIKKVIIDDFNLSVILPFYKKYAEFQKVIDNNSKFFQRNGIEVILVMDEPSEEELVLELLKSYPFINWIVLINREKHNWRNPAKTINVGIRASSKKYIMVCSPESLLFNDAILELRYIVETYQSCFAIGCVYFKSFSDENNEQLRQALPYGSMMVEKKYIEQVGGYSEYFDKWGGEDDQIRAKLEYIGCKKMFVPQALLIHYEYQHNGSNNRAEKSRELSMDLKMKALRPESSDFTDKSWGREFSEIIYHYKNNPFSYELCIAYLQQFKSFEIVKKDQFVKDYKFVILIHIYNEENHIQNAIDHFSNICDGIILLDDGSNDNSYEYAQSDKIICKVKKERNGYEELKNKNILLDIASFIKCDWFIFMDADERLHLFNKTLEKIFSRKRNKIAYCFYLVHLWDDKLNYRTDVPEGSPIAKKGVLHRWRMFRNVGRCQINSNLKVHFVAIPFKDEHKEILPILILHYGMINSDIRFTKYHNYLDIEEGNNKENYNYFLDTKVQTESLTQLLENMMM